MVGSGAVRDYDPARRKSEELKAGTGAESKEKEGFGTFSGVFTPCVLTILGVIMFLRFGHVVGNAGILHAVLIVALAKLITTLTALSLSAIATNTRVQSGGAYFLISRSLGIEFGGSIGVVFFLAQAASVALYVVGFTEAFLIAVPDLGLSPRLLGSLVNVAVLVVVFVGAQWAIKVQFAILAVLVLALISFAAGALKSFSPETLQTNLVSEYGIGKSFFTMFALFFPAATGIMAGANLSGDLKDPGRSIPRGTLAAILATGLIYLGMAVLLGGASDRDALLGNSMVVREVSIFGLLVTLGIFAATLSSAIGSMLGAPRILQALARDRIFSSLRWFAAGSGANKEPRRATVLSFLIAEAGILLGDLDQIAPIITMFFMVTYGYLNLATFYEGISRNPSYRPVFKFSHWSLSLAGALGCLGVMFLMDWQWAGGSLAVMAGLHWFISRRERIAAWGDARSGAAFERARRNLLALEEATYHPKNWRPAILALSGGAWSRVHLAVYAHWLTGGRGLLTLGQVIPGEVDDHHYRRASQEKSLRAFIADQELDAFAAVLVAPEVSQGIEALLQCHGMGAFRPNVALTGWCDDEEKQEGFGAMLRTIAQLDLSFAIVHFEHYSEDPWIPPPGPIDVWWRGKANGALMLLLAYLITQNPPWRNRRIRLLRLVGSEAGREEATEHLRELISEARIDADPRVIVGDDFPRVLRGTSRTAGLVFLGVQPPERGQEDEFVQQTEGLLQGIKVAILVHGVEGASVEA